MAGKCPELGCGIQIIQYIPDERANGGHGK